MSKPTIRAKVVLIGRSGVGKTSLVRRYVTNEFSERHVETIGVRVEKRTEVIGNEQVELLIWDVAGEEQAAALRNVYLEGAIAVAYVAAGSDCESLQGLDEFISDCRKLLGQPLEYALLNKVDLPVLPEAQSLFSELDITDKWQVSAKSGTEVAACFHAMASHILHRTTQQRPD